ncbi:MAG TPA: hypothetical protein VFY25_14480 [Anaerolineales bacterium]|nr:hypothetical protein [Anaerolineales bacterium]
MKEQYPNRIIQQFGYWSAALVTAETILFFISLALPNENLMFVSSFLLAPTFVAMMVSIHYYAPGEKRIWSHFGISLATIYAVMCALSYYIQLTVIQNNNLQITEDVLRPFMFIPGTPLFAQDMLGYVFMCAATLATGFVFQGGKLESWIKWLFIFNGLLFILPTLIIPAIPLPVNETGTGVGNKVGVYANMLWSVYFIVTAGLVTLLFKRMGKVK